MDRYQSYGRSTNFTFMNNSIIGDVGPDCSNGAVLNISEVYFGGSVTIHNNEASHVQHFLRLGARAIGGFEITNNTAVRGVVPTIADYGMQLGFADGGPLGLYRNYVHGFREGLMIKSWFSNAISNNLFIDNIDRGILVYSLPCSPTKDHSVFSNNIVVGSDYGFFSYQSKCHKIMNSVLWGNKKDFWWMQSEVTVEFNDTEKGVPVATGVTAENNMTVDPEFTDPERGIYTLKNSSPLIDKGNPDAGSYDPFDRLTYPTPNPATTPALPPAKGTIRNDIGAYGGPHAGPIGFVKPTEDDPSTPLIREDVIGTY